MAKIHGRHIGLFVPLALLVAIPVAAEVSVRIGGPTYLSSHASSGSLEDNTWHVGGNLLWSPRSEGTANLLVGAAYWRQEVDVAWPSYGMTADLVPIQCGARFHIGDPTRRSASIFFELTPTLTYVSLEVEPREGTIGAYEATSEDHLLLGSAVSGVFPYAISPSVGIELGLSGFWTEGFATRSGLLRWVDGFTVVAIQIGASWR